MTQKSGGLAGGGTPNEAQNIIYLHAKRSTEYIAAKAADLDVLTVRDYVEALAYFADRLKTTNDPGARHQITGAMRSGLDALIADCSSTEVSS